MTVMEALNVSFERAGMVPPTDKDEFMLHGDVTFGQMRISAGKEEEAIDLMRKIWLTGDKTEFTDLVDELWSVVDKESARQN